MNEKAKKKKLLKLLQELPIERGQIHRVSISFRDIINIIEDLLEVDQQHLSKEDYRYLCHTYMIIFNILLVNDNNELKAIQLTPDILLISLGTTIKKVLEYLPAGPVLGELTYRNIVQLYVQP